MACRHAPFKPQLCRGGQRFSLQLRSGCVLQSIRNELVAIAIQGKRPDPAGDRFE
jgi:hypothetical protein